MAKSRLGLIALGIFLTSFIFVCLAFVTSSWLVADGELESPKFEKLGLWFVCFNKFEDIRHLYDTKFSGCWWVYEEEYYIIHELLLSGFYIATQFFFTICFILSLIASFIVLIYLYTSKDDDNFECVLTVLGVDMISAAVCGTIAVLLFGFNGDSRYWMPNWEHNNMGWSFVVAVIGTGGLYIGGILFLIESRVHRIRHTQFRNGPAAGYDMQERRQYGHSNI